MKNEYLPVFYKHFKGFTLVESIIVLGMLSLVAIVIAMMQGNLFKGKIDNKNIQVGAQLMQECAEQVIATRRTIGYNAISSSNFGNKQCGTSTAFGSYDIPSVTIGSYSSNGCPTGGICKLVSITQGNLPPITLVLAPY